jgi:hypothetical protein
MSIVPREVLQLLFLTAGPSSFGVIRLVCKQWKRVVDSDEFKLVLERYPRCYIPERHRWLKNVVSERDNEEHLQFLPLSFSLFGDAGPSDTPHTPANFVGLPGSSELRRSENQRMDGFELVNSLSGDTPLNPWYMIIADQNEQQLRWKEYIKTIRTQNPHMQKTTIAPNRVQIDLDKKQSWTENIPDLNLQRIKENKDWKTKITDNDYQKGREARERFNRELKLKWQLPPRCTNSMLVAGPG